MCPWLLAGQDALNDQLRPFLDTVTVFFKETLYVVGLTKNRIYISGYKFWADESVDTGQVNVGNLGGIAVIKYYGQATDVDGYYDITREGCKVGIRLEKNTLSAEDNGGC